MHVISKLEEIPEQIRKAMVTIGNFDGVHVGHQQIMRRLVNEAHAENRKAVVMTFDPHPKMVLHPDIHPFYLITTVQEKINLLEQLGIDAVVMLKFSHEFAKISAESFVKDILWHNLRVKKIFIGHNYAFGNDKKGNDAYLKECGKELGFDVEVIDAVRMDRADISSTRVRKTILEGNVRESWKLLGRPYNVRGVVIAGHRRGAKLGFPTANIKPEKELIPPRGVYAVKAELDGGIRDGVLNIGYNPTFEDKQLSIELHIIDFDRDLYGKNINVLFIDRIRNEVKFSGPDALVAQIKQDVEKARHLLSADASKF